MTSFLADASTSRIATAPRMVCSKSEALTHPYAGVARSGLALQIGADCAAGRHARVGGRRSPRLVRLGRGLVAVTYKNESGRRVTASGSYALIDHAVAD